MNIPDIHIQKIIYGKIVDLKGLENIDDWAVNLNIGNFHEINWLNTPGPFYTTITDSLGFGQIEAPFNVSGDESWNEFIFKQPTNNKEVKQILNAASLETYGSYYIDGNSHWNSEKIKEWWSKAVDRINYLLERYNEELSREINPVYGPNRRVPENYKACLDYYQFEIQDYLEWYIFNLENIEIKLPKIDFDWANS